MRDPPGSTKEEPGSQRKTGVQRMTVRKSDERGLSDEDRPKVEKETVKDLEPAEGDRDVRGGQRTTLTQDANGCNS